MYILLSMQMYSLCECGCTEKIEEKKEGLTHICPFQRKTLRNVWEFMKGQQKRERERERERDRERETDICGSCKRMPLKAKVLNSALRSDKSKRYLVNIVSNKIFLRHYANPPPGEHHASDLPHWQWHHRKHRA